MTSVAQTAPAVTLYEADENGWDLRVTTSREGTACHVGRSKGAGLARFYCSVTVVPAEQRVTIIMFDDCPVARIPKLIQIGRALARRNGDWPRWDWARGVQRKGHEWLSVKLGDPVNVAHAFASLTERIDMTSEVTVCR